MKKSVFLIVAIKPLNDGTTGFRFNFFGKKGLFRKRGGKSLPRAKRVGSTMNAYDMGKFTLYLEKKRPSRKLAHFAG